MSSKFEYYRVVDTRIMLVEHEEYPYIDSIERAGFSMPLCPGTLVLIRTCASQMPGMFGERVFGYGLVRGRVAEIHMADITSGWLEKE